MTLGPHVRTMTGMMTVAIFAMVAATSWPGSPWLAGITGGLALLRLVVLVRHWPSSK